MDLFLDVNFSNETLAGYVLLTAVKKSKKAEKLVSLRNFFRKFIHLELQFASFRF